jgi:hypothetical protein
MKIINRFDGRRRGKDKVSMVVTYRLEVEDEVTSARSVAWPSRPGWAWVVRPSSFFSLSFSYFFFVFLELLI